MAMRTIIAGLVGCLVLSACAAGASEREDFSPMNSSGSPGTCRVTVPPQPGFVPPQPYPSEPPFEGVWYGTSELWTVLEPDGEVWADLPVGADGSVGDKTAWWSETFSSAEREDFSGLDDIKVTAVRLDGSARTVVEKSGVPSFNPDIKNFLLVGLVLPEAGCWEVTASYHGAELAYVLEVKK